MLTWLVLGLVAAGLSFLPPQPRWALIPIAVGVVATAALLRGALWPSAEPRAAAARLGRFAAANEMTYRARAAVPAAGPGLIFEHGTQPHTTDVVTIRAPREIEIGRHHWMAGRYGAESFAWSYAATPLATDGEALPHLVLAARVRWSEPHLPGSEDATLGRPELHGPGPEAYTVSAPIGRAAQVQRLLDATLFRHDVLARLTERRVDVEIVAGRLYLYTPRPMVTTDPDDWRWLLALVEDVAAAVEQPRATSG